MLQLNFAMSKIFNISGHKRAPDTSAPASKRYCAELANPSETFQSIRSEGYRTATYDVDTTVRQEEEHPRDPETLLAPVFVHSQQFSTPQPAPGTKPPGQINQRVLWRVGTNGMFTLKFQATCECEFESQHCPVTCVTTTRLGVRLAARAAPTAFFYVPFCNTASLCFDVSPRVSLRIRCAHATNVLWCRASIPKTCRNQAYH